MNLLAVLDELRSVAQNGLRYADDPYDENRYDRILRLVARCYGETFDVDSEAISERFREELTRTHVTPAIGAQAGIFDSANRILLQQRADTGAWCLPGGWIEPNESPASTAVRETREETGLEVRPEKLVDVYQLPPGERYGPHGQIVLLYLCSVEGGMLEHSHEGVDLAYRAIDEVTDWQNGHERFAREANRLAQSKP